MSDLSRLLGDVYGTGPAVEPQEEHEEEASPLPVAEGPAWADESVLDEAFANWVPGPPSDAPAAERAALSELASFAPDEPAEPAPAPETLAEALPVEAEWFFEVPAGATTATAPEPVLVLDPSVDVDATDETITVTPWQRNDDDLLPSRGRGRFRKRRSR